MAQNSPVPSPHQVWRDLSQNGQYVSAWDIVKAGLPPEEWNDPHWQGRAASLMEKLGADKRASRLVLRLWRRRESRAAIRNEAFWEVFTARNAYATWKWMKKHPMEGELTDQKRADELTRQAYVLGMLRDYEEAEKLIEQALQIKTDRSWTTVIKSCLHAWQDRHEQALETAREAVDQDPQYAAAVQQVAESLLALGRSEEAMEALDDALKTIQSQSLATQLFTVAFESDLLDKAAAALDTTEGFAPLAETEKLDWLAARRCDVACRRGDYEMARQQASLVQGSEFYKIIAERAASPGTTGRRHVLTVPFVKQHHVTCAPATLTSLGLFWGKKVDHLDIAETICYDGTPNHSERMWADQNGWSTREFTITAEAGRELIDLEIPFAMSTVEPGSAHSQAVVGYDEFRGTLVIRDPSKATKHEFLIEAGLKAQAPNGPRGMAMVPMENARLLAKVPLPDAELYDNAYAVELALEKHQRDQALVHVETLKRLSPEHRITLRTLESLAAYDANASKQLECLEKLVAMHPDEVNWQMRRISLMEGVKSWSERLAELRKASESKHGHPLLWRMLARELQHDERNYREARRWLNRLDRDRLDAISLYTEANMLWNEQKWEDACILYRFAASIKSRDEDLAQAYFRAACWVRKENEALEWLRRRQRREGKSWPYMTQTLYQSLMRLNRSDEGLALLEDTLEQYASHADHLLFAAKEFNSVGQTERARKLLEQAREGSRSSEWHRAAAELAKREGLPEVEAEHWNAVLLEEPLATDAHRARAAYLDSREDATVAINHLSKVCEKFPYNWSLHNLLLDWARHEGSEPWADAMRRMMIIRPHDAWTNRELALALMAGGHYDKAAEALDRAEALEPRSPSLHSIRASLALDQRTFEEGRRHCESALLLDVDHTAAIRTLMELCETHEQRMNALQFVQREIARQITGGEGLLEFTEVAKPYLEASKLDAFLISCHHERPDLWQSWSARGLFLVHSGRAAEAVALLKDACVRFPLLTTLWMNLAKAYAALPDKAMQIDALEKVRQINPGWGMGMRELAGALRAAARYDDALKVMEQAVQQRPLDTFNHGWLASLLWHKGEKAAAISSVRTSLRLEPRYSWAWKRLIDWGAEVSEPAEAQNMARKLTENRPKEARSWLQLAETLNQKTDYSERLKALDEGLEQNPNAVALLDEKSRQLALAGRFEVALKVCRPDFKGERPILLQMREAWIEGYRGNVEGGITLMKEALARDPAQKFGWSVLLGWHKDRSEGAEAETALKKLSQLQPQDPVPMGELASFQYNSGNITEARQTLTQALALSPDYHYGIRLLFDILLKQDVQAAAQHLQSSSPHLSQMENLSREFVIGTRQQDFEKALTALKKLLECPDDDEIEVAVVSNELNRWLPRNERKKLDKLLRTALAAKEVNPSAPALYVTWLGLRGKWPSKSILNRFPPESPQSSRALANWLDLIVDRYHSAMRTEVFFVHERYILRLRMMLRQNRDRLSATTLIWGKTGYATHSLKQNRLAADWLSTWRNYPDLEPWMLNNYFFALHGCGREKESLEVLHHILAVSDYDDTTVRFRLIAGFEAILSENEEEMREHLDSLDIRKLDSYDKGLQKIVDVVKAYLLDNNRRWNAADRAVLRRYLMTNVKDQTRRIFFNRACRFIARRTGQKRVLLWKTVTRFIPTTQ